MPPPTETRRCTRCILPDTWPGLGFDSEGVCDHCRGFEKRWGPWLRSPEVRQRSRAVLDRATRNGRARKRGHFDALVPVSGGKDSLEVLRIARQELGLECLAYTYDNGLMNPQALQNIRLVTEALDVPHVLDTRPEQPLLLKHFLQKTGLPCGACFIPMLLGAHRTARREGIRLVLMGLSRRNAPLMPVGKNPWHFRNVVEDGLGLPAIRGIWGDHPVFDFAADTLRGRLEVLCLPDHYDWDEEAIGMRLEERFGVHLGAEHSDCLASETVNWLWFRRYGFSIPTVKLSQKIRLGRISREEALDLLPRLESPDPPESLPVVARAAGLTPEELQACAGRDEGKYYSGVWNRLADLHRRIFLSR